MDKEKLQVENGNFTRIINPLIEELIKVPFKGCELAVAMFLIRKIYGFNKTQDEISLTQFEENLERTRPTIVKALKNLQLVNIVKLVKTGNSKTCANLWEINKYFETWKLVKSAKLVKHRVSTSKDKSIQLVKTAIHTKDNIQKTYTKERKILPQTTNKFFSLFEKNQIKEAIELLSDNWKEKLAEIPEENKQSVLKEFNKFVSYWTEPNKSGTKQLWETKPTFEINRRLASWFDRAQSFNNTGKKAGVIKV